MYINMCQKCYFRSFKLLKRWNFDGGVSYYHSDNVFGFKTKSRNVYKVPEEVLSHRCAESNFYRLVRAFREHAHKCSDINPVSFTKNYSVIPELDIKRYGLSERDTVRFKGIINCGAERGTVGEAVAFLNRVYRRRIAAEFLYLEDEVEIEWLGLELEKLPFKSLDEDTRMRLVTELLKSQSFDDFLAKKFASVKRYGGEGAESMMVFFSEIFQLAAKDNVEQIVLAMPHRGRLNLLTGMLNFPPVQMFAKVKGYPDFPKKYQATGDVLSHCIASTDLHYGDNSVHVSLLYNPSHLEAVNPVSMGKTRAKQMITEDGDYGGTKWGEKIINIQVHGDAAVIAQGVNQECLSLSGTPHFEIGGSVHLVVNNQLGFTTPAERGRSSRYCTDLAKVISAPVIHVNGDYPEDVLKVTKLAFEYQRKFRKEIFIDLNCYRQWGHNEMDDPTFTNPTLYGVIRSRAGTVPDLYAEQLVKDGVLTAEKCKEIKDNHYKWLNEHLMAVDNYQPADVYFKKQWEGFVQPGEVITTWDTGVDLDLMTFIGTKSVKCPENFDIHPTLLRTHIKNRLSKVTEGVNIDWSTAEALAIGSLLFEGYNVRISGQDVGRGTFSHRHVMLVDQQSNNIYIPLNNMYPEQTAFLEVANSILSEEAVLGYEYGFSVENPRNLIIWEAQFGDFFNGAQIIFDTFISSGETKWLWQSGLTILLPHGYDGAGPEHTSCRLERFLQMTDSKEDRADGDNISMQVCQPSTPAQYFHLLRRQMVRDFRKPLIIVTPKILLRHPSCVSNFADMVPGTYFKPVLGDQNVDSSMVRKVFLTSGQHYYTLAEKRESMRVRDVAIIRVESFCPFPTLELRHEVAKYPNAKVFVWCQEQHQNMGAWSFFKPRFENLVGKKIIYCGREPLSAPAVGVASFHQREVSEIVSKPFLIETDY